MATTVKITELPSIANLQDDDIILVNDTSAVTTKTITKADLFSQLELDIEEYLTNGVRDIVPNADNTHDLGSSVKKWRDVYVAGTIVADTVTAVNLTGTIGQNAFKLEDNNKATFGDDSDLKIYHNGTNSYIEDVGTGNLILLSNGPTGIILGKGPAASYERMVQAFPDSSVELYHNNNRKLRTVSTGVSVEGSVIIGGNSLSVSSGTLVLNDSDIATTTYVTNAIDAIPIVDIDGSVSKELFVRDLYVRDSNSSLITGIFADRLQSGGLHLVHNNRLQGFISSGGFSLFFNDSALNGYYTDKLVVSSTSPKMEFYSDAVRQGSSFGAVDFRWQSASTGSVQTIGTISYNQATVTYGGTSDYRLKENIVPLENALSRIDQIPVHRFNFKSMPEHTYDGFLSHEVQAVVPEAVVGEKDAVDSDLNIIPQMLDQGKLIPLLVASIQELKLKVESLESQITP